MRNSRRYTCTIRYSGGFDEGCGGIYERERSYYSTHRAGSKANEEDAITAWRRRNGCTGWCEVVPGTARINEEG